MLYTEQRTKLISVTSDLIANELLECTGGMLALRVSPDHLLTSTFGAGFRRWRLGLDDFIVCDNEGNVVEKHEHVGPASMLMILELFRMFPSCGAVLHSHAEFSLAFASLDRTMALRQPDLSVSEVPCLRADDQNIKEDYLRNPYPVKVPAAMPYRPEVVAVSQHLLPQLKAKLGHRGEELAGYGLAYTSYRHGLTVLASNIDDAFDAMARIEAQARTYIVGASITGSEALART